MNVTIDEAIDYIRNSCYVTHDKQQETREKIKCSVDKAIEIMQKYQKIEQMKRDMMYDIYMEGVNMSGEYHGCWVRFKDVENVVDRFFTEVLEDGKID